MIMDTLHCNNIPTAMSIITMMNKDQAIVNQLKGDLEKEMKVKFELQDKITKLEDNKTKVLWTNVELKLTTTDKEKSFLKEIDSLRE